MTVTVMGRARENYQGTHAMWNIPHYDSFDFDPRTASVSGDPNFRHSFSHNYFPKKPNTHRKLNTSRRKSSPAFEDAPLQVQSENICGPSPTPTSSTSSSGIVYLSKTPPRLVAFHKGDMAKTGSSLEKGKRNTKNNNFKTHQHPYPEYLEKDVPLRVKPSTSTHSLGNKMKKSTSYNRFLSHTSSSPHIISPISSSLSSPSPISDWSNHRQPYNHHIRHKYHNKPIKKSVSHPNVSLHRELIEKNLDSTSIDRKEFPRRSSFRRKRQGSITSINSKASKVSFASDVTHVSFDETGSKTISFIGYRHQPPTRKRGFPSHSNHRGDPSLPPLRERIQNYVRKKQILEHKVQSVKALRKEEEYMLPSNLQPPPQRKTPVQVIAEFSVSPSLEDDESNGRSDGYSGTSCGYCIIS